MIYQDLTFRHFRAFVSCELNGRLLVFSSFFVGVHVHCFQKVSVGEVQNICKAKSEPKLKYG